MIPEGKKRVMITIPEDVLEKLDAKCEELNCTKSELIIKLLDIYEVIG